MSPADRLARWKAVVDRPATEIELDLAALTLGDWDVEVDVDTARAELDRIAARAAAAAAASPGDGAWAGARAIAHTLYVDLGYTGNAADYYDPKNSFLAEVLVRRTGIPITLAVLYLEIARRTGVDARGVGFPGHFLVRVSAGDDHQLIDPFHRGAVLTAAELVELRQRIGGDDGGLDPRDLAPVTSPQILARMLLNLAGIYGRDSDLFRSLEVLERLAVLDKHNPRLAGDLEQLRARVAGLN